MKNRITKRFLTFSISSTAVVIFLSLVIIVFMFSGKDADLNNPRSITLLFSNYLEKDSSGKFQINQIGKKLLDDNKAWVQILDESGNEVYSYKKPNNIKSKYKPFEVIDTYIYDRDGSINFISSYDDYTILTGFPGNNISRFILDTADNKQEILMTFAIIIFTVGFMTYLVMGRLFSKKITGPVDLIIESIDNLDSLNKKSIEIHKDGLYENVFKNLRAFQERLEKAKQMEREFERQRNEWIANISHDLKTPLSSISGYSEIMSDEKYELTSKEVRKYSNIIQKQTKNIEHLINDLSLELKIKSLEEVLKKKAVNLNVFLKELVITILNNYQYSNRDVSFDEEGKVIMEIDKELFGRAITNLVTNALKHSGKKAQVKVILEKTSKGHCRILIIDNGKGIPKNKLGNLFQRYYRGESTEEVEGTGLGMSIAKNVIEAHGGSIKVDSIVDEGTTVTIEL